MIGSIKLIPYKGIEGIIIGVIRFPYMCVCVSKINDNNDNTGSE